MPRLHHANCRRTQVFFMSLLYSSETMARQPPRTLGRDLGLWVPGVGTSTSLQASKPQSRGRRLCPALCLALPGPQRCTAHCLAFSPCGFALLRCFTVPDSWDRNKVFGVGFCSGAQVLKEKAQQCFSLHLVLSLFIKNCYYNMQYAYGAYA